MFCEKDFLKNFTIFIEKIPVLEPDFNKIAGLFIKKDAQTQMFSCEYCEIFKNTCFNEHLQTVLITSGIVESAILIFIETYTTHFIAQKVSWQNISTMPLKLK